MYKEGKILARPLRCGEAVVKPDAPRGTGSETASL